ISSWRRRSGTRSWISRPTADGRTGGRAGAGAETCPDRCGAGVGSALVDEAELAAWGEQFARALPQDGRPVVVAPQSDLGTGKTTLVRAIARGLGVNDSVTSPTFALVHRYAGAPRSVWHVDAYRLKPGDDARDLGLDRMLSEDGIVLIEWPERLGAAAPPASYRLRLAYTGDLSRRKLEW